MIVGKGTSTLLSITGCCKNLMVRVALVRAILVLVNCFSNRAVLFTTSFCNRRVFGVLTFRPFAPMPLPLPWCMFAIGMQLGTSEKISRGYKYKEHIVKAIELNPSDAVCRYLHGRWCFEVAQIDWLTRRAAAALFGAPPTATIEEALVGTLDCAATHHAQCIELFRSTASLCPTTSAMPANMLTNLRMPTFSRQYHPNHIYALRPTRADTTILLRACTLVSC